MYLKVFTFLVCLMRVGGCDNPCQFFGNFLRVAAGVVVVGGSLRCGRGPVPAGRGWWADITLALMGQRPARRECPVPTAM